MQNLCECGDGGGCVHACMWALSTLCVSMCLHLYVRAIWVEEGKAEHCSGVEQSFWALVISPEDSEQVKASKRGMEEGRLAEGCNRGRMQRGSKRMCQRIMRNDTAVVVKGADRFVQSNTRRDTRTHTYMHMLDSNKRLNAVAVTVNAFIFLFSIQMPCFVNDCFWTESLFLWWIYLLIKSAPFPDDLAQFCYKLQTLILAYIKTC